MRILATLAVLLAGAASLKAAKTLDIYFIDVEGGQATLLVSPGGESILIDAGWPGNGGRDADRIAATARQAGLKRIDYLLVTHYHLDHVGGVAEVAERIPVAAFIDHGPNLETGKNATTLYENYAKVRAKGKHILVKPGDKLPMKDFEFQVVAAAGNLIRSPLKGAGQPNPLCSQTPRKAVDNSENGGSIGSIISFGKFRFVNLADITWNKELELVCPNNLLGMVDLYLVTHHGMNMSGPAAIVHALRPRAAVMNNGAKKGGTPEAWQAVNSSPELEGFWQLHYTLTAGKENNAPADYIANLAEQCQGHSIKVSAERSGAFTVTNTRNGFTRTYPQKQ